ncbi:MAG: peptidoglycan DD-metalloendopeptidase family protein [Gemmataceae bacterium]
MSRVNTHSTSPHLTIKASVGSGGVNLRDDVLTVQRLLNRHRTRPIKEDGLVGPETIGAINAYQGMVLKMPRPDGKVDVGGPTWKSLSHSGGQHPATVKQHAPSGGRLNWPLFGRFVVTAGFGHHSGPHSDHAHKGIDLSGNPGTPVHAAGDGRVLYSGAAKGYGHWVVIQHSGLTTIYGHVYGTGLPSPGTSVRAGDVIAKIGAHEGHTTGPHLHFEVHQGGYSGRAIDPITVLPRR